MVPDREENYRGCENESRDGIDFGRDTAPKAAPDFEMKRVVAADQEKRDGDFIHGERKDEQTRGDEREAEIGQSNEAKGAPWRRTEVGRGFLLPTVDFLQARENLGRGHGNKRGAVTQ